MARIERFSNALPPVTIAINQFNPAWIDYTLPTARDQGPESTLARYWEGQCRSLVYFGERD